MNAPHWLLLCLLAAGAAGARAQTSALDLPWCNANPTEPNISGFAPACPGLGEEGRWTEFGILFDDGAHDRIEVVVGPSAGMSRGWSGTPATAGPQWVEASVVALERLRMWSVLSSLHRSCARDPGLLGSHCISLGQAYRAVQIAAEHGPQLVPLPRHRLRADGGIDWLERRFAWPKRFSKPETLLSVFLDMGSYRWSALGVPGMRTHDRQCATHVCDRQVHTPDQISRIVDEVKAGLRAEEVRVDSDHRCKYVPLCEFTRPQAQ
jgi:hypothetical protein